MVACCSYIVYYFRKKTHTGYYCLSFSGLNVINAIPEKTVTVKQIV